MVAVETTYLLVCGMLGMADVFHGLPARWSWLLRYAMGLAIPVGFQLSLPLLYFCLPVRIDYSEWQEKYFPAF